MSYSCYVTGVKPKKKKGFPLYYFPSMNISVGTGVMAGESDEIEDRLDFNSGTAMSAIISLL